MDWSGGCQDDRRCASPSSFLLVPHFDQNASALSPGIVIIFGWRLIAKKVLHKILPPIFRRVSTLFTLPTRRFYTPATDYKRYPRESVFHHPIPSVIDLPAMNEDQMGLGDRLPVTVRRRGQRKNGVSNNDGEKAVTILREASDVTDGVTDAPFEERENAKRYDANGERRLCLTLSTIVWLLTGSTVLTKVIVYGGIAFLAAGATPVLVSPQHCPIPRSLSFPSH